jgi:hypothetical protein
MKFFVVSCEVEGVHESNFTRKGFGKGANDDCNGWQQAATV